MVVEIFYCIQLLYILQEPQWLFYNNANVEEPFIYKDSYTL